MADKDLSDDKSIHASTKQAQPEAQAVLSTPEVEPTLTRIERRRVAEMHFTEAEMMKDERAAT
jgi:hypothetical protein